MKIFLDNGAFIPTRGHPMDAGLDLRAPYSFTIWPGERKDVDTGVHVKLPYDTAAFVTGKSGLMRDKGIFCPPGTIDASYRGSIHAILINVSRSPCDFEVGDKIAQLVVVPCKIVDVEQVQNLDDLGATERMFDGFGSTGKK